MGSVKAFFKRIIKVALSYCGIKLIKIHTQHNRTGLNINVGCGNYEIFGFESLDYYSDHYYGSKGKFKKVHYDMRNDALPYATDTVDTIYCSHVIEHIETEFVKKFFFDAFRVLRSGGVLRIACPDSKYLFRQYKKHPVYFRWHSLYSSKQGAELCFIDEVGSPKTYLPNYGLKRNISDYSYEDLMDALRDSNKFDSSRPGRHINNWDFTRVKEYGTHAGFHDIQKSRFQGSYHPTFQASDIDLTHPQMSLYVDLKKD